MAPRVFSYYDPPPSEGLSFKGEKSMTRQADAESADINKIMARYEMTGEGLPDMVAEAFFADVTEIPDFRTAVEMVNRGNELFMQLPAKVRAEFDNDPAAFVDFAARSENRDRLVEMGLLPKPVEIPEVKPPVSPPPAGGGAAGAAAGA